MKNIRRKMGLTLFLTLVLGFSLTVGAKSLDTNFAVNALCMLIDSQTVSFEAGFSEVPASDDGVMYLYELAAYQYDIPENAQPIASVAASVNPKFTFALNHKASNTKLYSKFVVAVHQGGSKIMLCNPQYIVNPEILATHTRARINHSFKTTQTESFTNLNITGRYDSNYHLNRVVQIMNRGEDQAITNPYARREMIGADSHPIEFNGYYMLNASEPGAITTLANTISQYAANSKAEDWLIGNEVNNRKWNYMIWNDWDNYIREYEQVFRVAYNAIKSENANARVYICLEQDWNRDRPLNHSEYFEYIDAKDFIAKFSEDMKKSGDVDWGVSEHPYIVPLTYAKFWDMSECPGGAYMINMVSSNKMLSFQNLSIFTDYMTQPELLSPTGAVRHLICSEIGITSHQGDEVQAAALYASYYAASHNPYIEQIIYLTNSPAYGFNLTQKAQEIYNNMEGPNTEAYSEWAKSVIGISDWSQVLR